MDLGKREQMGSCRFSGILFGVLGSWAPILSQQQAAIILWTSPEACSCSKSRSPNALAVTVDGFAGPFRLFTIPQPSEPQAQPAPESDRPLIPQTQIQGPDQNFALRTHPPVLLAAPRVPSHCTSLSSDLQALDDGPDKRLGTSCPSNVWRLD